MVEAYGRSCPGHGGPSGQAKAESATCSSGGERRLAGAAADRPTVYSTTDGGPPGSHTSCRISLRMTPRWGETDSAGWIGKRLLHARHAAAGFRGHRVRRLRRPGGAFTSFDGGKTWRALAPPPQETGYSDFVFQDSTHWWATRFGTLWKSADAGQTWKHVASCSTTLSTGRT